MLKIFSFICLVWLYLILRAQQLRHQDGVVDLELAFGRDLDTQLDST